MMLINGLMYLREITCIFSLRSIEKNSFQLFILPHLTPNIFFCFPNHQGALLIFILFSSLPSSVLQWHDEEGSFFSQYDQSNDIFY